MPVSAETLQLLMEAGLEGERLLAVVRSIDADMSADISADKTRTETGHERRKRLDRERKWRARHADNGADIRADMSADLPPQGKEVPPDPPKKTQPQDSPLSAPSGPSPPTGGAKRGSRIPADFPGQREIDDVLGKVDGLDRPRAEREAPKFRDYWLAQPGQRGVKLDWLATWRNWCRKALEMNSGPGPPERPISGAAKYLIDDWNERNGQRDFDDQDDGFAPAAAEP